MCGVIEIQNDTKLLLACCQFCPTSISAGECRDAVTSNCVLLIDLLCRFLFRGFLSDHDVLLKYWCMHCKPNYFTATDMAKDLICMLALLCRMWVNGCALPQGAVILLTDAPQLKKKRECLLNVAVAALLASEQAFDDQGKRDRQLFFPGTSLLILANPPLRGRRSLIC